MGTHPVNTSQSGNTGKPLTIGKLADAAGVSVETIRFYEREGVLPAAQRTASNYRVYDQAAVARLRFVSRAKTLGFSLAEIRTLLQLQDGGDRADVRAIAQQHLDDIDARLADLTAMRGVLADAVARCQGHGPVASCPIVHAIQTLPANRQRS